jgi:DNA-binding PadR family transcriptional regulator
MSMNETARILCAISADKPMYLGEFFERLGTERPGWHVIHTALVDLEAQELVKIHRRARTISAVQLTSLGAERAREAMEGDKLPERKPNSKSGLVIDA